ncbi:MAG: hypothetical protein QME48_01175 [bacterium]|nr:hypothetical protein [bacterium]
MKKILVFLFIFSLFLKIFSAYIYVYDKSTYDSIVFVKVSYDGKTYQLKTPFEIQKGKEISLSSLGYKEKRFKVTDDTMSIYLEIEPFMYKPLVVENERIESDILNIKIEEKDLFSIIKKIPQVTLREYNRSYIISVDGLLNEDNILSIDGVPIVNQQSRMVPISLFPKNLCSSLNFYKNDRSNFLGENLFSSGIDFRIEKSDKTKINITFDDKKSYDIDLTLSFKGFKFGKFYFDKNDLVLPYGEKLKNSYQNGFCNYFYFKRDFFSILYIYGKSQTGDPGILGHRFFNSTIFEGNRIFNLTFNLSKFLKIFYSNNIYTYIYDNKDLKVFDTSKTFSDNIIIKFEKNKSGVGTFFQKNFIKSTKVSNVNEYFYGLFSNLILGSLKFSNSFSFSSNFNEDFLKKNYVYSFTVSKEFYLKDYIFYNSIKISTRRPTFNELYWVGDIFSKGNENLLNEKIFSYSLTFSDEEKKFFAGFNYYKDLIRWININGVYSPQNILKTYNPYIGFEYNKKFFNINNSLTLTISPMILERFKLLLYTSPLNLNYFAFYTFKNFNFFLYLEYRSIRFLNNENTKYLPFYISLDETGVEYNLKNFVLTFSIINPFDLRIESVKGYIKEGRKVTFNLKMEV